LPRSVMTSFARATNSVFQATFFAEGSFKCHSRTWRSRPSCCEGHRYLKGARATKRMEKSSGLRSMIKRGVAFYALVHVCAVRSRRADREWRALRTVPSRCLRVGKESGPPQALVPAMLAVPITVISLFTLFAKECARWLVSQTTFQLIALNLPDAAEKRVRFQRNSGHWLNFAPLPTTKLQRPKMARRRWRQSQSSGPSSS